MSPSLEDCGGAEGTVSSISPGAGRYSFKRYPLEWKGMRDREWGRGRGSDRGLLS